MRVLIVCFSLIGFCLASGNKASRKPASVSGSKVKSLRNLGLKSNDIQRNVYSADLYQEQKTLQEGREFKPHKLTDERVGQVTLK